MVDHESAIVGFETYNLQLPGHLKVSWCQNYNGVWEYRCTCITSCGMLIMDLLKAWDWPGGKIPHRMKDISGMDTVVIWRKNRKNS